MTKFQDYIFKKIIGYHWFHYSNGDYGIEDKRFTLSLSRVCWQFHQHISSLNNKFSGSFQDIDTLLKFHFQNPNNEDNKCAIYKEIVELHCESGALRDVSFEHLKLTIPSIKILGCGSGDLDMMLKNGMALDHLHIPISISYSDEYDVVRKLLPPLQKLDIGVSIGDNEDEDEIFDSNPFIKFIFSAPFRHLTHLTIRDNDEYGQFSMYVLEQGVNSFFTGLTSMSSLQSLEMSLTAEVDTMDEYPDFINMLVQYLKTQKTLKHFSFTEEINEGYDYLEFLLQKSSIESLNLFLAYDVEVTREISKLSVWCQSKDYSNLAMTESLTLKGHCFFTSLESLLEKTPSSLKVLRCTVGITATNIPDSFLKALSQSTLERIYIDFILLGQGNKQANLDTVKPIDDIIQKHKSIRNTDSWFIKQY